MAALTKKLVGPDGKGTWLSVCASMVSAAFLVAACGDGPDEPRTAGGGQSDIERFVALFAGGTSDYEPAASPAELADRSSLVVTGTIDGFDAGRIYGSSVDDPEASRTAVMRVAVRQALKGELPAGSAGTVYIELFGVENPSAYERVAPRDASVLLYLIELPAGGVVPGSVTNPDAGHPPGQPLFGFATPQGFLLEVLGDVVQPPEGTKFSGASLERFEPTDTKFPPESSRYAGSR